MKREPFFFLVVLILLLSSRISNGQSNILSENAEISILTMGPYEKELYSAFGHSAIRVHDPINGIDLAFNYGTFDFDQPNFYLNFARGNLLYKLSVQRYPDLARYYVYFDRFINEQELNLTQEQKQKVFDFLANNARPENANYYYDYFYDNCATRIRDVFVEALGDEINFDGSYIDTDYTIRELTDLYLVGKYPWGDLGIDICLGLPMDKVATPYEYMFLPDYVESGFDHATIVQEGRKIPIVKVTNHVFEAKDSSFALVYITPLLVFSTFFLITCVVTYFHWKKNKKGRYFDATVFIVSGLVGLLLTVLWFGTDHNSAAKNMNILWAFPLNVIGGIMLIRNKPLPGWLNKYFFYYSFLLIILLIFWQILPQKLHFSLIPVAGLLFVRALYVSKSKAYNK